MGKRFHGHIRKHSRAPRHWLLLLAPLLLMPVSAAARGHAPIVTFLPAPMPKRDIVGPIEQSAPTTTVSAHLFSSIDDTDFWREGDMSGVTIAEIEERHHFHPAPGLSISVPLQ